MPAFSSRPRVAQAFSLTSLITYVSNIANVQSQLSGSQSSMNNFNSNVVVPALQLTSLRSWLSLAETNYQGWFNAVLRVPVSSASITNTSSLETAMRAGYSGGTGSSIASNYSGVYGARTYHNTGKFPGCLSGGHVGFDSAGRLGAGGKLR